MPLDLNRLLSEVDIQDLLDDLDDFELSLRIHVHDGELFDINGEVNRRSRFGAALFHSRNLRSLLRNLMSEVPA